MKSSCSVHAPHFDRGTIVLRVATLNLIHWTFLTAIGFPDLQSQCSFSGKQSKNGFPFTERMSDIQWCQYSTFLGKQHKMI